jgi:hypothetical protein
LKNIDFIEFFAEAAVRQSRRKGPLSALHVNLAPDLSAKSASHLDRRHSVSAPRLSGRFAETWQ